MASILLEEYIQDCRIEYRQAYVFIGDRHVDIISIDPLVVKYFTLIPIRIEIFIQDEIDMYNSYSRIVAYNPHPWQENVVILAKMLSGEYLLPHDVKLEDNVFCTACGEALRLKLRYEEL